MIKNWIQKKEFKQAVKKLDSVTDIMPAPDVLNLFHKLTDAYGESQNTKKELAKIQAQKEVVIIEIEKKYELYHHVFDRIFAERGVAITKSFEIIDQGLSSGDKDLISMGLQSLSKIVSSSPFANFQQLSNMLEGNQIIEI